MRSFILSVAVFALVLVSSADAGGFGVNVNVGGGLFGRRKAPQRVQFVPVQQVPVYNNGRQFRGFGGYQQQRVQFVPVPSYGFSSGFQSFGYGASFGASAGGCGAFLGY